MNKILAIDSEKCSGCRVCEMICSAVKYQVINPFRSRIKIIKWEIEGEGFPMVCAQCVSAPCQASCLVGAISKDEKLRRTQIDYDKCIGCRMCIIACPFGVVVFDSMSNSVIKCDLCDGDPQCVKHCSYGALQYVDVSELGTQKRSTTAKKLSDLAHSISAALSHPDELRPQ